MEQLEVDILMNSKGEWGHNHVPRGSYDTNNPGNTHASNTGNTSLIGNTGAANPVVNLDNPRSNIATHSEEGNRQTDRQEVGNNEPIPGNKRQQQEDFDNQYAQHRLRRRLATRQTRQEEELAVGQGNLATELNRESNRVATKQNPGPNPNLPRLATANKWREIHRARTGGGNKAGNKVPEIGNRKKKKFEMAAQNPTQKTLLSWLKCD